MSYNVIFGASNYAMTLEEVAAELGVTASRVQQIERKALAKCRAAFNASRLSDVMDGDELPDVIWQ